MSKGNEPVQTGEFAQCLSDCLPEFGTLDKLGVAVSGGPDSLALAALLHDVAQTNNGRPALHVISVDHGLRAESAQEVEHVKQLVDGWLNTQHVTLCWRGDKPASGVQEAARAARYALIAEYCQAHHIRYVCLAQHADDQAETLLFRLARGSGLDGLAGMQARQALGDDISIIRPLLSVAKYRLIATCEARGLGYIDDPANADTRFSRPRLRQAYDVLAGEGLTGQRLQRTARRLWRARSALEHYTQTAIDNYVDRQADSWAIRRADFCALPEDIALRIMQAAFAALGNGGDYPPRMEKQESLLTRLRGDTAFKGATLGGCRFTLDRRDYIYISPEIGHKS